MLFLAIPVRFELTKNWLDRPAPQATRRRDQIKKKIPVFTQESFFKTLYSLILDDPVQVTILIMLAETSSIAASIEIMSVNYKLSHFLNLYIIYKKFFPVFVKKQRAVNFDGNKDRTRTCNLRPYGRRSKPIELLY